MYVQVYLKEIDLSERRLGKAKNAEEIIYDNSLFYMTLEEYMFLYDKNLHVDDLLFSCYAA